MVSVALCKSSIAQPLRKENHHSGRQDTVHRGLKRQHPSLKSRLLLHGHAPIDNDVIG
jgi:hypothetical protein